MADRTFEGPTNIIRKLVDMLDGTHAEKVVTEPLGIPSVPRNLPAAAVSADIALTATCARVSLCAVGADIFYSVGTGPQTATAASHWIFEGERLDIRVLPGSHIAAIRAGSTDGVLCVSELA